MPAASRVASAVVTSTRSQFRASRNTDSTVGDRTRRVFWASALLLRAVSRGLLSVRKECLGSEVIYNGKRCHVSNWASGDRPTLIGAGGFYQENVPRAEIRNIRTPGEYAHRFAFGLTFYLHNWYGIEVNRKVHG